MRKQMKCEIMDSLLTKFFSLLSNVGFILPLFCSSNLFADTPASDCLDFELKSDVYYQYFIEPKRYKSLDIFHDAICQRVKDGRWDLERANSVMSSMLFRLGTCRGENINSKYKTFLKEGAEFPDSVILTYEHYCKVTFDPERWGGESGLTCDQNVNGSEMKSFAG
jgi:hypothetical protein